MLIFRHNIKICLQFLAINFSYKMSHYLFRGLWIVSYFTGDVWPFIT